MKTYIIILVVIVFGIASYLLFAQKNLPDKMAADKTNTIMSDHQSDTATSDQNHASDSAMTDTTKQDVDTKMMQDEKMGSQDKKDEDSKMMGAGGQYLPFSSTALTDTKDTRRVLFFYANWCPTCQPADKDFTNNASKLPKDVSVIRVNYSDNDTDQAEKDLAKKYGITYQHTFVQIDAQGNEIAKWNGGQVADLLNNLK